MDASDLSSIVAVVFVWIAPVVAVATFLWMARARRDGAGPPRRQ